MNENIMERIIRLIGEKGLKDKDVYEPLGIDQSTFSTWKRRKTAPLKHMKDIAFALGVSRHYLETGVFEEEEEYSDMLNRRPILKRLLDAAVNSSDKEIEAIIKTIEVFSDVHKEGDSDETSERLRQCL